MIISFILGLMSWMSAINPREAGFSWSLRIFAPLVFVASLVAIIFVAKAMEKAPDFLVKLRLPRIGRDKFVYVFESLSIKGWAVIRVHYQNMFSHSAQVVIGINPSQNFTMSRNNIEPMLVKFLAGPGAYGWVDVPYLLPIELQGQTQKFDVAEHVAYQDGPGDVVRASVGETMSKLGSSPMWHNAKTLIKIAIRGEMINNFKWQSRIKVTLPSNVKATAKELPAIVQNDVWKLGDPEPKE